MSAVTAVVWADAPVTLWAQPAFPVLMAKLRMRQPPFNWECKCESFVLNVWEIGVPYVERWLMQVKLVPTSDGAKIFRVKKYEPDAHLAPPTACVAMADAALNQPQLDSVYWAVTSQGARVPLIDFADSSSDSPAYTRFTRSELAAHRVVKVTTTPQIAIMR